MRRDTYHRHEGGRDVHHDSEEWCGQTDRVPVVVIDPGDRTSVTELLRSYWARGDGDGGDLDQYPHFVDRFQAALSEWADPPAIEEPTNRWAVVEDAEGVQWVRVCEHTNDCNSWRKAELYDISAGDDMGQNRRHWPDVRAVRILSEGVVVDS